MIASTLLMFAILYAILAVVLICVAFVFYFVYGFKAQTSTVRYVCAGLSVVAMSLAVVCMYLAGEMAHRAYQPAAQPQPVYQKTLAPTSYCHHTSKKRTHRARYYV